MAQETVKYTVKWLMQDKKLIKFVERPDDFTLSSKVAAYDHAKYGIKSGVKVDVAINGNEVTYLRKSETAEKETPKTETKTSEPNKESDVFTWTVAGLPEDKKVISFKEAPDQPRWYIVPDEMKARLEELGVKARIVVKITFAKSIGEDNKEKRTLTSIDIAQQPTAEPPKEATPKAAEPYQPGAAARGKVNDSIERQCAWKTAGETISKACQGQVSLNDIDVLTAKIKALAEEGIKFIQQS